MERIGFPIVEFCENTDSASFTVMKPAKSGGLVRFGTVAEQM